MTIKDFMTAVITLFLVFSFIVGFGSFLTCLAELLLTLRVSL